ncbi:hypothetical protein [Streptomyces sp. NPDC051997]|uniref:hypothetical protein n=1 Tax=Streptomyces sp. NPDC051997 TaxID=3155611 RepID=UPI00343B7DD7
MSGFRTVGPMEAHPTRDEYVLERALSDGGWVVESIFPAPSAEKAEARHAELNLSWVAPADFRVVRRTITSTVISVHPSAGPVRPGEEPAT